MEGYGLRSQLESHRRDVVGPFHWLWNFQAFAIEVYKDESQGRWEGAVLRRYWNGGSNWISEVFKQPAFELLVTELEGHIRENYPPEDIPWKEAPTAWCRL